MKGFLIITLIGLIVTFCTAAPDCINSPDGISLPHEEICEYFYVCKDQKAVQKKCPAGLHFSPIDLYCLPPKEAGCDESGTTGTGTTSTTTKSPHPGPSPDPKLCKSHSLGTNIPHPTDCTKYITCIGGGVFRACPKGTHFNANIQVCDWIERAGCEKLIN